MGSAKDLFGIFSGLIAAAAMMSGCSAVPNSSSFENPPAVSVSAGQAGNLNPLFVQTEDPRYLWESVVDVIDNYFPIPREYPIQTYKYQDENGVTQSVQTEGRIDTDPVIAAGLFEPWKKNSVTCDQRLEATFQTVRRSAVVRIVPEDGGYYIHLAVYNELEDLAQPMNAGASGSNLLFSDDFSRLEFPTGQVPFHEGWIPTGRNNDMEQFLLQEMAWRFQCAPVVLNPENAAEPVSSLQSSRNVPVIP